MGMPWANTLKWAAGGALAVGGAASLYNKMEGNQGGSGNAGMIGAAAGAAWALSRGKGAGAKAFLSGGKELMGKVAASKGGNAITNTVNSWGQKGAQAAGEWAGKSENAWVKKLSQTGVRAGVGGAIPGAVYGGAAGAVYGAFSDRDSMLGGAMKGALAGAAIGGAYRLNKTYKIGAQINTKLNKTTSKALGDAQGLSAHGMGLNGTADAELAKLHNQANKIKIAHNQTAARAVPAVAPIVPAKAVTNNFAEHIVDAKIHNANVPAPTPPPGGIQSWINSGRPSSQPVAPKKLHNGGWGDHPTFPAQISRAKFGYSPLVPGKGGNQKESFLGYIFGRGK